MKKKRKIPISYKHIIMDKYKNNLNKIKLLKEAKIVYDNIFGKGMRRHKLLSQKIPIKAFSGKEVYSFISNDHRKLATNRNGFIKLSYIKNSSRSKIFTIRETYNDPLRDHLVYWKTVRYIKTTLRKNIK